MSICEQNGNQEYDEIIETLDREETVRLYPGAGPRPNADEQYR